MGQVNTEQAIEIFNAGAETVREAVVIEAEPTSYLVPVIIAVVTGVFGLIGIWLKVKLSKKK